MLQNYQDYIQGTAHDECSYLGQSNKYYHCNEQFIDIKISETSYHAQLKFAFINCPFKTKYCCTLNYSFRQVVLFHWHTVSKAD